MFRRKSSRLLPRCSALVVLALFELGSTSSASAQVPTGSDSAPEPRVGPREHFEQALELYRAGKYAQALDHLSRAAELDPNGKDLFYNLALVHEKLGQLPQAIAALERYRELETEATERERARIIIERLRGAEVVAKPSAEPPPCAARAEAPPAPPPPRAPNVALIGAASISAVAIVVGTVFGAKAIAGDVGDARTGPGFSPEQLREQGRRAERDALVADVAFAVGAAAAGTFAAVWLLSPSEPRERAAGITLRSYF